MATLLIAGTTIGAGMLGIPLITSHIGFLPATFVTLLVWLFMMGTGFLFLEATLWMPQKSNILTITQKILGPKGKWLGGATFVFLYYSLMIAYFAAILPLFHAGLEELFQASLPRLLSFTLFTLLLGLLLVFGIYWIGRMNVFLMGGLILSYFVLIRVGAPYFSWEQPFSFSWSQMGFSAPILFSAFGYHNVIPSLTFHFQKDRLLMRKAIFWGTFLPCSIYLIWQWLIMGILSPRYIEQALQEGAPVTAALQYFLQKQELMQWGNRFAFFAIITSMLGVSLSMVDFLADGLGWESTGKDRKKLCLLTLLPPALFAWMDPKIFVTALSIAGGFGEAFLNGILPALLVWRGKYILKHPTSCFWLSQKSQLALLLLAALLVMGLEVAFLTSYH